MEDIILKAKRLFYSYWMQSGKVYSQALDELIQQQIKEAEGLQEATENKVELIKILIEWQKQKERP